MRAVEVGIRPYVPEDAEQLVEAVQESIAELLPWAPWCHRGYALSDAKQWLDVQVPAFVASSQFQFAIVDGARILGSCGLGQIDNVNRRANLGYWVRSSMARKGIATAAVCAVQDWAFAHTDLIRLEIVVAVGNLASRRVAERAGATFEGVLRKRLILNSETHDAGMFSFHSATRARELE